MRAVSSMYLPIFCTMHVFLFNFINSIWHLCKSVVILNQWGWKENS